MHADTIADFPTPERATERSMWRTPVGSSRVSHLDVALFAEQFRALVSSGIPINEALSLLARSTATSAPRLAATLDDIRRNVEEGSSLGDAFREHEHVFGRLAVELIATGEATGTLERTLGDLAEDCEHRHRNRATVVSALVEPVLIVALGLAVSYVLVTVTVPQFKTLFEGLAAGASLPLPTRLVIDVSDVLLSPFGIAATLLVVAGAIVGALSAVRSERVRYRLHRALLRVPLVGAVALLDAVGRGCRTLAVVHRSVGEIPMGIELAARTTTNLRVAEAFEEMGEDVYDGRMLWEAMRDTKVMPELTVFMTKSGEESGQLDTLLAKLADTYETTVRYRRERMLAVLRYGLLLVMGGFVLFIMLAMYLPVFSLIEQMRR
jgi:type IV pilus assembly protein PilC